VCLLLCCVQLADPWERAKDMLLQGSVVDGMISGFNKGGVLVELDGELKGEKEGGHERGGDGG
jgi:ribosomal protein S1